MGISADIKPKNKKRTERNARENQKAEDFDSLDVEISVNENRGVTDQFYDYSETEPEDEETADKSQESDFFAIPAKKDIDKPEKKSRLGSAILILIFLLLVGILSWQNIDRIKSLFGISSYESKTDDSTEIKGQSYTDGSQSTKTTETPSQTTTETPPATTPSIEKSAVKVEVLNGNGVANSAAEVKTKIIASGFTVSKVANASKYTYPSTIIYYKNNYSTFADEIKTTLSTRECTTEENAQIVGSYDIVVVVGKK